MTTIEKIIPAESSRDCRRGSRAAALLPDVAGSLKFNVQLFGNQLIVFIVFEKPIAALFKDDAVG